MADFYEMVYKDANKLIDKYGTNNPQDILIERGVTLLPFKAKTHALGMYIIIKRNKFVLYNPFIDNNLKRMMLAHELGHDLYHQDHAKEGLSEFTLFNIKGRIEYEANLFASHLLLNNNEIFEYGKQGYDIEQIARVMNVNINLLLFKFYGMNRLGHNFHLSQSLDMKFFKDIDGQSGDTF